MYSYCLVHKYFLNLDPKLPIFEYFLNFISQFADILYEYFLNLDPSNLTQIILFNYKPNKHSIFYNWPFFGVANAGIIISSVHCPQELQRIFICTFNSVKHSIRKWHKLHICTVLLPNYPGGSVHNTVYILALLYIC